MAKTDDHWSSRMKRGVGAQGFSQAVQVFIRFAEVPLFLGVWGAQLYGEWLMLAAIPLYLAMTDAGFTSAATHDMAMRAGAGNRQGALKVFRSAWILITIASLTVGAIVVAFAYAVPLGDWFGFEDMGPDTVSAVVLVLAVYVLAGIQTGLLYGGFWCEGEYATGMLLLALSRALEFGALAAVILLGGGPVVAALSYTAGRFAGLVVMRLWLYRSVPWLRYGFSGASRSEMQRLTRPAFASLAFPLGNALNIQGVRLVVGAVLGPAALAVFVPIRTLSQLALQPKQVISLLVEPEMSLAFGRSDLGLFRGLFRRSCQAALWSSVFVSIAVAVAGPAIMEVWTRGEVELDWLLFGFLLAATAVNSLWSMAMMVAYSTNRHERIGLVYGAVYGGMGLVLAYIGAQVAGFAGVGLALLLIECMVAAYVVPATVRMSGETWRSWLGSFRTPPWSFVKYLKPRTPS